MNRVVRVAGIAVCAAAVLLRPGEAIADHRDRDRGGLPEVWRDLRREIAERKAGDVAVAQAARAALDALGVVLNKAIADGDDRTIEAARAADQALGQYLEAVIAKEAAATTAAAQAANDALEERLRQLVAAADAATLVEGKVYADKKADEAKAHADQKAEQAKTDSKSHADQKAEQARNDSKSYTDSKLNQTKTEGTTESKNYTDTKTGQTKSESLAEAKAYTDAKVNEATAQSTGEAKAHADANLAQSLAYADAKLAEAKEYTDSKLGKKPMAAGAVAVLALDGGNFAAWGDAVQTGLGAEVIEERISADGAVRKHVGAPKPGLITLTAKTAHMSAALGQWIDGMMKAAFARKNGVLYLLAPGGKVQDQVEFFNAVLVGIEFPEIGADAEEPCQVRITIGPEYSRLRVGGPLPFTPPAPVPATSCDFLLSAGEIATPALRMQALKVERPLGESGIGSERDYEILPLRPRISHLRFSVAAEHADDWRDWFSQYVVAGNPDLKKDGALRFSTKGVELASLELAGLGIFELSLSGPGQFDIGLFVERASFESPGLNP
jgi:hypothetical protein